MMQTTATNQNSQKSTSQTAQKSLHGNKPQSGASAVHQKQAQPQAQQRVRPEGMSRSAWKNFKNMRRVLAIWPELFTTDNPKPLKTGVLNDLMQDIAARNLTVGAGALKAAVASYVRRIRYKKAIAAGGARYDINGQPCGEVTPEQQQEAADDIKKADEKQAKGKADGR
ncbi:TPA: ProQ/FINO family protein [Salmonella enterica subsp. diarizonae serovar 61:r:-]